MDFPHLDNHATGADLIRNSHTYLERTAKMD
jgi:hypothetical protein